MNENENEIVPTARTTAPSRGEQLAAKREEQRRIAKIRSIAFQAWLLPILTVGVALLCVVIFKRPNLIMGLVNLALIIYASTCTIRTWVNIRRGEPGLWLQVLFATVFNGLMLTAIGFTIAAVIRSPF